MKRHILIAIFAFAYCVQGNTQTQRNWYLIGGNISDINLDLQKGNTGFSFNLSPRVAWFIRDDLAVGGEVQFGLQTGDGFTTIRYGVGPVARYFIGTSLQSVRGTRWFLDGNVGFFGTNTKVSGSASTNTNGLGIGIGPGLAYFINQNIALEALAKYNLTVGFGNATTINSINVGLGFQIYLPKSRLRSMKKDVQ